MIELCFSYQETTDYARPIVFGAQVGLQDPDHGPVLDESWPTVVRTEVRDFLTTHPVFKSSSDFIQVNIERKG